MEVKVIEITANNRHIVEVYAQLLRTLENLNVREKTLREELSTFNPRQRELNEALKRETALASQGLGFGENSVLQLSDDGKYIVVYP